MSFVQQIGQWLDLFHSLKSVVYLALPILLFISRSLLKRYHRSKLRPLPARVYPLIAVLALTSVFQAYFGFVYEQSLPNVYELTGSRLQTENTVLGLRLKHIFRVPELDEKYQLLVDRLASRGGREMYSKYGPVPLMECQWCRSDEPVSFFMYSLARMTLPYLVNWLGVLIATSSVSRDSRQWRVMALAFLAMIAAADLSGMRPVVREEVLRFWDEARKRTIILIAFNALLSLLLFMSGVGILFGIHSPDQVIHKIRQSLDESSERLVATQLVNQATRADKDMMDQMSGYYDKERTNVWMSEEELQIANDWTQVSTTAVRSQVAELINKYINE
ncbi:hypothetical protein TRVA0_013S02146 [Trichomonascus vanleenenianus]|uniref:uncharacterized protein n=1 Tax=Trichomonascus vanleenenianus TaxID=2268995 RepID=UPI003EC9748A